MSDSCTIFGNNKPKPNTQRSASIKSYCTTCKPTFLIVVGDPGQGEHSLGELANYAAYYHYIEIQNNKYPGIRSYDKNKHTLLPPIRISSVDDLNNLLGRHGNIMYIAYFGHSWGHYGNNYQGALYLGDANAPGTNLSNAPGGNNKPVSSLTNAIHLNPNAQIRLFGCQGGFTGYPGANTYPPARQIADMVPKGVTVFGYAGAGGSAFTTKSELGYRGYIGKVSKSELTKMNEAAKKAKKGDPLWLATYGTTGWNSWKK